MKKQALVLLLGLAASSSYGSEPKWFDRYSGDWVGVERVHATGQCSFNPNRSEVKYYVQVAPDGQFSATAYAPSGELQTRSTLKGSISPDGKIRFARHTIAVCNGVAREVSYPGRGTLTNGDSDPAMKLITKEDMCPNICTFRVERSIRRASSSPGS